MWQRIADKRYRVMFKDAMAGLHYSNISIEAKDGKCKKQVFNYKKYINFIFAVYFFLLLSFVSMFIYLLLF